MTPQNVDRIKVFCKSEKSQRTIRRKRNATLYRSQGVQKERPLKTRKRREESREQCGWRKERNWTVHATVDQTREDSSTAAFRRVAKLRKEEKYKRKRGEIRGLEKTKSRAQRNQNKRRSCAQLGKGRRPRHSKSERREHNKVGAWTARKKQRIENSRVLMRKKCAGLSRHA